MHRIGFIVPQRFQLMSLAALTGWTVADIRKRMAETSSCNRAL